MSGPLFLPCHQTLPGSMPRGVREETSGHQGFCLILKSVQGPSETGGVKYLRPQKNRAAYSYPLPVPLHILINKVSLKCTQSGEIQTQKVRGHIRRDGANSLDERWFNESHNQPYDFGPSLNLCFLGRDNTCIFSIGLF